MRDNWKYCLSFNHNIIILSLLPLSGGQMCQRKRVRMASVPWKACVVRIFGLSLSVCSIVKQASELRSRHTFFTILWNDVLLDMVSVSMIRLQSYNNLFFSLYYLCLFHLKTDSFTYVTKGIFQFHTILIIVLNSGTNAKHISYLANIQLGTVDLL